MKIYSWLTTTPVLVTAVFCVAVIMSRSLPQGTDRDQGLIDEYQLETNLQEAHIRSELKATILRELVNGHISLPLAAMEIHDTLDPVSEARIRQMFPAKTAEESVAMQTIAVLKTINLEPHRLEEVVNRLESELAEMKEQVPVY
jgi:hypothetical protein